MGKYQGKVEIRTAKNGKEYFVVKAENGKILVKSQEYKSHTAVLIGIRALAQAMSQNYITVQNSNRDVRRGELIPTKKDSVTQSYVPVKERMTLLNRFKDLLGISRPGS